MTQYQGGFPDVCAFKKTLYFSFLLSFWCVPWCLLSTCSLFADSFESGLQTMWSVKNGLCWLMRRNKVFKCWNKFQEQAARRDFIHTVSHLRGPQCWLLQNLPPLPLRGGDQSRSERESSSTAHAWLNSRAPFLWLAHICPLSHQNPIIPILDELREGFLAWGGGAGGSTPNSHLVI